MRWWSWHSNWCWRIQEVPSRLEVLLSLRLRLRLRLCLCLCLSLSLCLSLGMNQFLRSCELLRKVCSSLGSW
jgi:hypothetical protein